MTDQTTARPVTDARFLAVLVAVADQVVDQTGTSNNGEVWIDRYRGDVSPWEDPNAEIITPDVWIAEQVDAALREPATSEGHKVRAMLEARARLGENIRLIEGINPDHIRRTLDTKHPLAADLDMLLDFVAEVRQIAKDI